MTKYEKLQNLLNEKQNVSGLRKKKNLLIKDGILATIVDMLPEDREYAITSYKPKNYDKE